ncbi:MAG TPA: fumarylacetoacetate hydrolase family protein [Candidatus Saccharimonadales bacterium]|nr:fumarylacetoacetate hydrolase family protein [Candidatus Saccharimonadales bacterium]
MQLVRYESRGHGPRLGLLEKGRVHDLEAASGGRASGGDMKAFIKLGRAAVDEIAAAARKSEGVGADSVKLLTPIANPGKLIAVAGGYYTHEGAERLGKDAIPMLFAKRTDDIRGPGDPITIWKMSPGVVDEIEVAIVIGVGGKNIARSKAMDHVIGYTICNDVSGREVATPPPGRRDKEMDGFLDWLNGKWMDGFAILGPAIVTKSEAGDLSDVQIQSIVSGDVRVAGSTKNVNIPWDELIAFSSRFMTLNPGDVITTGMPHGTGEEKFLKPGDVVEGVIERLGTLKNPVVAEA